MKFIAAAAGLAASAFAAPAAQGDQYYPDYRHCYPDPWRCEPPHEWETPCHRHCHHECEWHPEPEWKPEPEPEPEPKYECYLTCEKKDCWSDESDWWKQYNAAAGAIAARAEDVSTVTTTAEDALQEGDVLDQVVDTVDETLNTVHYVTKDVTNDATDVIKEVTDIKTDVTEDVIETVEEILDNQEDNRGPQGGSEDPGECKDDDFCKVKCSKEQCDRLYGDDEDYDEWWREHHKKGCKKDKKKEHRRKCCHKYNECLRGDRKTCEKYGHLFL